MIVIFSLWSCRPQREELIKPNAATSPKEHQAEQASVQDWISKNPLSFESIKYTKSANARGLIASENQESFIPKPEDAKYYEYASKTVALIPLHRKAKVIYNKQYAYVRRLRVVFDAQNKVQQSDIVEVIGHFKTQEEAHQQLLSLKPKGESIIVIRDLQFKIIRAFNRLETVPMTSKIVPKKQNKIISNKATLAMAQAPDISEAPETSGTPETTEDPGKTEAPIMPGIYGLDYIWDYASPVFVDAIPIYIDPNEVPLPIRPEPGPVYEPEPDLGEEFPQEDPFKNFPIPIPDNVSKELKAIAHKDSRMTEEQWNKLDDVLKEFVDNCLYKASYEYLVNKKIKIRFIINPKLIPFGEYKYKNKAIELNPTRIVLSTFQEEMFHAFQDHFYPEGLKKFIDSKTTGMIEYESKVIQDIISIGKKESVSIEQLPIRMKGLTCTFREPYKNDKDSLVSVELQIDYAVSYQSNLLKLGRKDDKPRIPTADEIKVFINEDYIDLFMEQKKPAYKTNKIKNFPLNAFKNLLNHNDC